MIYFFPEMMKFLCLLILSRWFGVALNKNLREDADNSRKCPEGFTKNDNFCTKSTPEIECPYKDTTAFVNYAQYVKENQIILLPVKYNGDFGYHRWIEKDIYLGGPLSVPEGTLVTPSEGDCVLANFTSGTYQLASCNHNVASTFCAYDLEAETDFCRAYDRICSLEFEAKNCFCQSDMATKHFCFTLLCRSEMNLDERCTQCDQLFNSYSPPELTLYIYNGKPNIIIRNPLKLKHSSLTDNPYVCHTDVPPVVYDPIHSKPTPQSKDQILYDEYYVQERELSIKNKDSYVLQCYGFSYPDSKLISSNRIQVWRPAKIGFVMSTTLPVHTNSHLNDPFEEALDQMHQYLVTSGNLTVKEVLPEAQALSAYVHFEPLVNRSTDLVELFNDLRARLPETIAVSGAAFCLEDVTQDPVNGKLHWPRTKVLKVASPIGLCFGEQPSRKCSGDFIHGAYWEEPEGNCSKPKSSQITGDLLDLLHSSRESNHINEKLHRLIKGNSASSYDLFLVGKLLEKIGDGDNKFNLETTAKTISLLIDYNRRVLAAAQEEFNATDFILGGFEEALRNYAKDAPSGTTVTVDNLGIHIAAVKDSLKTILGFYEGGKVRVFSNLKLLDRDGLKFAAFFPGAEEENPPGQMVTLVYKKLDLFVATNQTSSRVVGWVPNIFMTGSSVLQAPVEIWFKPFRNYRKEKVCSFWKYGSQVDGKTRSLEYPIRGKLPEEVDPVWEKLPKEEDPVWKELTPKDASFYSKVASHQNLSFRESPRVPTQRLRPPGGDESHIKGFWLQETLPVERDEFQACAFDHMTHFALLINGVEDKVLNVISTVGSGLSLVGISGIFLTAVCFKRWRDTISTKILINFSLTILAQMVLLFQASLLDSYEDETSCLIVAILLHYITISQFSWMALIGYLQYKRFVLVFTDTPPYLLFVSLGVGWILPAIPTALTFFLSPSSYLADEYCYLTGNGLFFGAFLPIGLVVFFNLVVFLKIFLGLCNRDVQAYGTKTLDRFLLHLRLAILLFFLMGFTWIFGLLNGFFNTVTFSYLFSITTSLQGLVLFCFHVALNKNIRMMWVRMFKTVKANTTMESFKS